MYISFLYPYNIRNESAPFLWVFYKLISKFEPEDIVFIGSKEYFQDPKLFTGRWELSESAVRDKDYNIPSKEKIDSYKRVVIDKTIFEQLENKYENCLLTWKKLMMGNYEPLETKLKTIFESLDLENVDAVLSWCNCPSLTNAAKAVNKRVIHNELGALRADDYLPTAYFDFKGVNGNTSSEEDFKEFEKENIPEKELLDLESLIYLFRNMINKDRENLESQNKFEAGVALQVEDDSNIIAFSNNMTNLDIINNVRFKYKNNEILIREHPGSKFICRDNSFKIDTSMNSYEFIKKCKKIYTINSSVSLEAMLLNKEVQIYGENPFKFISLENDDQKKLKMINFALFVYMIPYELLFDKKYYLWRLENPSLYDIFKKHRSFYLHLKGIEFDCTAKIKDVVLYKRISILNKSTEKFKTDLKNKDLLIENKNELIREQQDKINNKNELIHEQQDKINNKNELIREQQDKINNKNELIREQQDKINKFELNLVEVNKKISFKENIIDSKANIINNKDKNIKNLQKRIKNLEKQIETINRNKDKEIDQLQNEITFMHMSKSWKITRPLRKLKRLFNVK